MGSEVVNLFRSSSSINSLLCVCVCLCLPPERFVFLPQLPSSITINQDGWGRSAACAARTVSVCGGAAGTKAPRCSDGENIKMDHEMRADVPQAAASSGVWLRGSRDLFQNRLVLRDPRSKDPSFSRCYLLRGRLTVSDSESIFQYRIHPVQTRARPAVGSSHFNFLFLHISTSFICAWFLDA